MAHVPLFIDLEGKCVLIFGGGRVGERKAKMFCAYGQTTVVSTSFTAELLKMAESGLIDVIVDDLKDVNKYLTGAFIVVPATDNRRLNTYIADQAKAMNILVNQVDGIGEVIVPSIINKGDIHIGISTMGKSPASARYLRLRIEELIKTVALMVTLQDKLRTILKKKIVSQLERKRILEIIINDQGVWIELARSYDAGLQAALEIVENEELMLQAKIRGGRT
ncbi:MAG: precorrin-2 dehydrogenase/sirohydrochlorin ferrochelatase family protein [Halobacteriota archaeon]